MPSTSRSRGSSGGGHGSSRAPMLAPMSERQQMALVMQLTTQNAPPVTQSPAEERKRTRQQRNERGETPLHVAAIKGDHELVKKLLEQGLDPDGPDFAGWTPLHEACSYGWYEVVEVLVHGGANVNAKGLDDDTPLHDATTSGNLKMVRFLVENGADPTMKNSKGKAAVDYADQPIYDYLHSVMDVASSNRRKLQTRRKSKSTRKQFWRNVTKSGDIGTKTVLRREMQRKTPSNNKDNGPKSSIGARSRDDNSKKGGNASDTTKRTMEGVAQDPEGKEATPAGEKVASDSKDTESHSIVSSGVVTSSQDDAKRPYYDDGDDADEEVAKKKKRYDDKEAMGKPNAVSRGSTSRVVTSTKTPGPASKTSSTNVGKSSSSSAKSSSSSLTKGSTNIKSTGTKVGPQNNVQGKSSSGSKGSSSMSKDRQKSPVPSPKSSQKDDDDDAKVPETSAPKVPPLKIVIPGGAGGSSSRNEQEGEGLRGSGKGRGSAAMPYVIPCTSADTGPTSDSSDTNSDEKRSGDSGKAQRVLRSHRGHDEFEQRCTGGSGQDGEHNLSVSNSCKNESRSAVELHPRKRKIKVSKEQHSREMSKSSAEAIESVSHAVQHSNPYQMYIHIRKQIDQRQKSLFPVKPKPPKDFNKYLMNRCTYTLDRNVNPDPQIELPLSLPMQMKELFIAQEKERHRLRIQHLIEKEKLVLAVEQEILRVHGRAERAVANQSLPFSVCTMLRDKEVYNVLAPEQEEKRNAQRSRCNGRQINSWLQEVDDKWEKIKEGMLRRQHTEAETLHAIQTMGWEWKLKEVGLCDYKTTPKIDTTHVPQIHVSNFDLPA